LKDIKEKKGNKLIKKKKWGLGIGPNPQSPIPNPQSPIPNPHPLNINK
jgi:hypothetical protein